MADQPRADIADQGVPSGSRGAAHGLKSVPFLDRYSSSRQDLVAEFYAPALAASVRYDRAAGFFRSSVYSLLARSLASFVEANGSMRLLCSPELTADDLGAIRRGVETEHIIESAARRELQSMLEHPMALEPVEVLANLVASGILEIRFAIRSDGHGIFHDKVGVFSDDMGAQVSFSGSVNESRQAWHPLGNNESFEVFRSWIEESRVADHSLYFDSLWSGEEASVLVYEAPEAFRQDLITRASDQPRDALIKSRSRSQGRRLFDHQQLALQDWASKGYRGLLKHATGSGKTLTALHGIRDWLAAGKPAIVLVPSTLLLEQWKREAAIELASLDPSVLLAGGGHDEWRRGGLLRLHTQSDGSARLVIATMQTAASDEFQGAVADNPDLLLVADEAHRLGAPRMRQAMLPTCLARLGLSATPERAGDRVGTDALFAYFGKVLDPVFTLRDAIDAGRLVPYVYEPLVVDLDADETVAWVKATEKIRQVYAQEIDQDGDPSDYLKMLLIKRARIPKLAVAKIPAACDLVVRNYAHGQHWLLYCADRFQLASLMEALRLNGIPVMEYHSSMIGDREATLDRFTRNGGVLVSIRCLDEGVDIPSISHAVILASSRNYREFVQRRGRVLRTAPDKTVAYIWDLLVLPSAAHGQADEYDGLVFGELIRAAEFAHGALNQNARIVLDRLCIELGIDPNLANIGGIEEEDDDDDISAHGA